MTAGQRSNVTLPGGTSVRVRLADDATDGISSVGRDAKLDLGEALAQVGEAWRR